MKKRITSIVLICFCTFIYSQTRQINNNGDNLVSSMAFNKLVLRDINFMILGENTPQQGVLFELNDDQSSIKASGYLGSTKDFFFTLDGEFSVDNGVYLFDENDGSKKSKFTLNAYLPTGKASRKYGNLSKAKTKRAFLKKNLFLQDSIEKIFYTYKGLYEFMKSSELPTETDEIEDKYYNSMIEAINNYDSSIVIDPNKEITITDQYNIASEKDTIVVSVTGNGRKVNDFLQTIPINIDVSSLIEDYEEAKSQLDNVLEIATEEEIEIAKGLWSSKNVSFFGLSGFYQRESTTLFEFKEGATSFNNLFTDITGDVYGITGSYNWIIQWKKQRYFIARGVSTYSRSSNIDEFTQRTINLDIPTGDVIDGTPITIANSRKGYVGDSRYTYGFRHSHDIELYGSFLNPFGLFGTIGYNRIGFSDDSGIKDREKFPMRLGLLFNLKTKDEQKNILTLQVFLDRQNLNDDPNGKDKDLRFGFKVGLPVNISKKI